MTPTNNPDTTPDPSAAEPSTRPRLGEAGVFAGDWAFYPGPDATMRVPVGFAGTLIDWCNGHAVFSCERVVAEAIVADQDRLRGAERQRLCATGLDAAAVAAGVDEAYPLMFFDGDDIVVDERAQHGEQGLSRIGPDEHGRYIVNGWHWTWHVVAAGDCDRVSGHEPGDLT